MSHRDALWRVIPLEEKMAARRKAAFVAVFVAIISFQPSLLTRQNPPAGEKRAALISELAGIASVRAHSSAPPSAVERFTAIAEGAILEVGRDSRAVVVLAGGKRFVLGAQARATVHADRLASTAGQVDELSSLPALPPLVALDAHAPKALGGVRLRSSVIAGLSPSNGSALASRTILRFTPTPGAATYRVEIENEQGRVVFGLQTTSPEVAVPPTVLHAGTAYYWTVRTIDRSGAQARGSAGFVTLRDEEAKAREDLRRRLQQDGDASSLALLAAIDRHLGLQHEALEGFRAALARAPDDEALVEAVRELEAMREAGGR
jgi:hypothetical protein